MGTSGLSLGENNSHINVSQIYMYYMKNSTHFHDMLFVVQCMEASHKDNE